MRPQRSDALLSGLLIYGALFALLWILFSCGLAFAFLWMGWIELFRRSPWWMNLGIASGGAVFAFLTQRALMSVLVRRAGARRSTMTAEDSRYSK